jgi:hypothetical protein
MLLFVFAEEDVAKEEKSIAKEIEKIHHDEGM